jgi:tetraacyldisaccharide 4'-kinase
MLREPLRALERADAILLTRAPSSAMERSGWLEEEHLPRELHRALQRLPGPWRPPVAAARHRPAAWVDESKTAHPPEALAGRSVLALSAIGAPEGFESTLRQLGARVAGHRVWPDHHRFTAADLSEVAERKRALGEPTLITTAKDAVRWPAEGPPITVLTVRLEVAQEAALLEAVMAALGGCCRERG